MPRDDQLFESSSVPLPITHSDFSFSLLREIMVGRNSILPIMMMELEYIPGRFGFKITGITCPDVEEELYADQE